MPKSRSGRRRAKNLYGQKLSLMVLNRTRDAMELVSSIKAAKPHLAEALAERYAPNLREGEELPDYGLALELAVRDVMSTLALLLELDDQVAFAAADRKNLGHERQRLVDEEVYARVVAVRGAIDLAFDQVTARYLHGLRGRTERKPPGLERQLRRTLFRLTDSSLSWPPARNPHAAVDRAGWIRQLEPLYRELKKLNDAFGGSEHRLGGLVTEKKKAMAAFDVAYADGLRYVRSSYKLAGFDDRILKNLKPYHQRRRLSERARKARQARAAAAEGAVQPAPEASRPAAKENTRVAIPKAVARWLRQNRLFGT